jgi:hypothetical protein
MCMGRRLGAREIRASLEFEGGDLVGDLSKYGVWNLVDMAQSLVAKCQHRTFGIHIILQSTNTSTRGPWHVHDPITCTGDFFLPIFKTLLLKPQYLYHISLKL